MQILNIYHLLLPWQRLRLSFVLMVFQLLVMVLFTANIIHTHLTYSSSIGNVHKTAQGYDCNCYDPYVNTWILIPVKESNLFGKIDQEILINKSRDVILMSWEAYIYLQFFYFLMCSFAAFILPVSVCYVIIA